MIKNFTLLLFMIVMVMTCAKAEVIVLKSPQEIKQLFRQNKPVVIMQGAEWCPACKSAAPKYMEADRRFNGKVLFAFIDVDHMSFESDRQSQYIPNFLAGKNEKDVRSAVSLSLLSDDRSVEGIVNYVSHFTGVEPELK